MTNNHKLFDNERAGAIYRTAAQMIYENGFNATSMSQIADAVQLTKPGLYYYVKGKKELLHAIMAFAMDLLETEVVRPAEKIDDPAERLRVVVAEHARLLTHEQGTLAILIDEVDGLSEKYRQEIVGRKRRYFDFVRSTLEELRQAGRLRDVDTTVAAFSMLGMVMWLSRWYSSDGRLRGSEVARDITEIALGGLLREPERASPETSQVTSGADDPPSAPT